MACLFRRNKSKIWHVRYQRHGTRVQRSSRTTDKGKARDFLAGLLANDGNQPSAELRKTAFSALCDAYEEQHLPLLKAGTQLNYRGHIKVLRTHFGAQPIGEIRQVDIGDLVARLRRSGLKSGTVRRYLTTLSSLFAFAVRAGWVDQSKLPHLEKRSLPESRPRVRFLSAEEYRRLFDAAAPHLQPILKIAVTTGMRHDEILGLKWTEVDLDRKEVLLENTKNDRPRVVPLPEDAVAVLVATQEAAMGPYVFTNPATGTRYIDVWQSFQSACRRAAIVNFRFHDLRHTFATWAVQSGMDLYRLSRILGHSSVAMTTRYAHLATEQLHEAVQSMAKSMSAKNSEPHSSAAQVLGALESLSKTLGIPDNSSTLDDGGGLSRELAAHMARRLVAGI